MPLSREQKSISLRGLRGDLQQSARRPTMVSTETYNVLRADHHAKCGIVAVKCGIVVGRCEIAVGRCGFTAGKWF